MLGNSMKQLCLMCKHPKTVKLHVVQTKTMAGKDCNKSKFGISQSTLCLSTFDPSLTSVSAPYDAQGRHISLSLARLEEVGFGIARMHRHRELTWL